MIVEGGRRKEEEGRNKNMITMRAKTEGTRRTRTCHVEGKIEACRCEEESIGRWKR